MKTKTILVALCLIAGFTTAPNGAEAAGYQIGENTAVFFTTFTMDASYGSFEVPVAADYTVSYTDRVDVVGYKLTSDEESNSSITNVSDIVLSNAPIIGTRYQIATGTVATFTLLSVVTFNEPIDTDVASTITKIPFWVDGQRTSIHETQLAEVQSSTLE